MTILERIRLTFMLWRGTWDQIIGKRSKFALFFEVDTVVKIVLVLYLFFQQFPGTSGKKTNAQVGSI